MQVPIFRFLASLLASLVALRAFVYFLFLRDADDVARGEIMSCYLRKNKISRIATFRRTSKVAYSTNTSNPPSPSCILQPSTRSHHEGHDERFGAACCLVDGPRNHPSGRFGAAHSRSSCSSIANQRSSSSAALDVIVHSDTFKSSLIGSD
jgi:hypothetical protein